MVLSGRDLLGAAQTGTGKTAGFTLPLLQRLAPFASKSFSPALHPVRCLILTPTRELAIQVYESVKTYGKHIALKPFVVYGGVNINPQIAEMRKGVEILVATPGRLLDLMGQKAVDLRQVQILVLDEADRMLDMGFIPDIKRIINTIPGSRQTLLFSATFSDEIRKLSAQFLKDPLTVEVARRNTPAESVTQWAHFVESKRKRELLAHLVKTNNWEQVLVFCKTKHGANRLAYQLERDGINAAAIHGNKSQNARIEALESFKANKVRVLVATDIAARGLDIEALPHVVNFDMPTVARGLRPPHRPHRPRGHGRRGDLHRLRRGPPDVRGGGSAHQEEDRGPPGARLRRCASRDLPRRSPGAVARRAWPRPRPATQRAGRAPTAPRREARPTSVRLAARSAPRSVLPAPRSAPRKARPGRRRSRSRRPATWISPSPTSRRRTRSRSSSPTRPR